MGKLTMASPEEEVADIAGRSFEMALLINPSLVCGGGGASTIQSSETLVVVRNKKTGTSLFPLLTFPDGTFTARLPSGKTIQSRGPTSLSHNLTCRTKTRTQGFAHLFVLSRLQLLANGFWLQPILDEQGHRVTVS
jgi:hypothetical protein